MRRARETALRILTASSTPTSLTASLMELGGTVYHKNVYKHAHRHNCQTTDYVLLLIFCSRRHCYLKRDITMPAPIQVDKYGDIVSGFSLKNCFANSVINSGSSYGQTVLSSTSACTTIGFLYMFSLILF